MNPLLLLHGALGTSSQFTPLIEALGNSFDILTYNFSGHGGTSFRHSFGIEAFTQEVHEFLQKNNIKKTHLAGYSMGGYVALNYARLYPRQTGKVATIATKFNWTPESASQEAKMLDPEKIEAKVPAFAKMLEDRHSPNDWKELLRKTSEMMSDLGQHPLLGARELGQIEHPVMICVGENDHMVSKEESERASRSLPNGHLLVLENTHHAIEKMDVLKLAETLMSFFA